MALIQATLHSQALMSEMDVIVIIPDSIDKWADEAGSCTGRCPVLYLLHGMSDDQSIWLRRTSIERYADDHGIIVVMPTTYLGFYTDMCMGDMYWQYITKELPATCRSLFPQMSRKREDTFVAGLSMGGYGALKCGLRAPETFSWAAGLSACCDVAALANEANLAAPRYFFDIFGPAEEVKGSFNDLFAAAEDMAKSDGPKTQLYMWCGTEDFLYQQNVRFRDHVCALKLPLVYEESPGIHAWPYWDAKIQTVLNWLPLEKEAK